MVLGRVDPDCCEARRPGLVAPAAPIHRPVRGAGNLKRDVRDLARLFFPDPVRSRPPDLARRIQRRPRHDSWRPNAILALDLNGVVESALSQLAPELGGVTVTGIRKDHVVSDAPSNCI